MKKYFFILFFIANTIQVFSQKTYTKRQVIDISNYIYLLEGRDSIFNAKINSVHDNEILTIKDTVRKVSRLVEKYDSLFNRSADLTNKNNKADSIYNALKSQFDALKNGNNNSSNVSNVSSFKSLAFEVDKSSLTEDAKKALDETAEYLKINKEKRIKIEGNADNSGEFSHNIQLSSKRAKAVKNYLVSKGIERARIYTIGLGPDNPVSSNDNSEGKAKNRRAEIFLLN